MQLATNCDRLIRIWLFLLFWTSAIQSESKNYWGENKRWWPIGRSILISRKYGCIADGDASTTAFPDIATFLLKLVIPPRGLKKSFWLKLFHDESEFPEQ